MHSRYFSDRVVEWYRENHRKLPWRGSRDPYRIWLSEIILQQTRVNQGLPYYKEFVSRYPTVKKLAQAKEEEVLRLWQGLGYYSRARNLHKCAQKVAFELKGKFPDTFEGLKSLPGIGDYTAAAIASICYKAPHAVVDGNVFRVLARIFGVRADIASTEGKIYFGSLANRLLSKADPDIHNQGVMEFGALLCKPKQPQCPICPFQPHCKAFINQEVSILPIKTKGRPATKQYFYYFVIEKNGRLGMKRRGEKDIWQGLFDFYTIVKSRPTSLSVLLASDNHLKTLDSNQIKDVGKYEHRLTHRTIIARFFHLQWQTGMMGTEGKSNELRFFTKKRIEELPKPILINNFLKDHYS